MAYETKMGKLMLESESRLKEVLPQSVLSANEQHRIKLNLPEHPNENPNHDSFEPIHYLNAFIL